MAFEDDNPHLFFDCDKKQTFKVTEREYKRCQREYQMSLKIAEDAVRRTGFCVVPVFALNGCANWIYKDDEDYSNMAL